MAVAIGEDRAADTAAVQAVAPAVLADVAAAFVRGVARPPGGAFTAGDVVLIGGHAYAAGGIATAAVAGGSPNYENVIGGNLANVDTAASNLDGAPVLAGENGNWNFLLGGYDTVVNGWACSVVGFHCKINAGANHITIGGGSRHVAAADAAYGTIGGGTLNEVAGNEATVAGGRSNKATANTALVSGGANNTASASAAVVSGGTSNAASNANAVIVGGNSNVASGNSASVGGGLTNTASATAATVPGGRDNTASGTNSLATGRGAVALENGQHAHAAVPFTTPGDAQVNRWSLKKQTTDATAANLEADTGAPPVIPQNTTWAFSALVVARRADADGDNAAYEVRGCLKRDTGNTAALVGVPSVTALGASAGAAAWTVSVAAFSVGTLRLIVTGEAAKTVRWVAELRAAQVSG